MWNLKHISAQNFLSYKEFSFDVKSKKTTLIYGKNLTDSGVSSNGSGKSSTLEILCFCLTGNSLRKVTNKELIRNGEKEAFLSITLENPVLKKTLRIERKLNLTKASDVSLYEDDKLREDLKDLKPSETDKEVLRQLEISYSDIVNYYLISKEKYTSLLLSSDTQKKEVINRFSKADYIDKVFPQLDTNIATQENSVNSFKNQIISANSKIELLQEQIQQAKDRDVKSEVESEIEKLNEEITSKQLSITNKEKSIAGLKVLMSDKEIELDTYSKQLSSDKNVSNLNLEIGELEKEILSKKDNFTNVVKKEAETNWREVRDLVREVKANCLSLESDVNKAEKTLSDLKKIEAGEIECPSCKHTFSLNDGEITLEDCKLLIVETEKEIETLTIDLNEQKATLTESQTLLEELAKDLEKLEEEFKTSIEVIQLKVEEKQSLVDSFEKENRVTKSKVANIESEIERYKRNIVADEESIAILENSIRTIEDQIKVIKNRPNPIVEEIKKLNSQIKELENSLLTINESLEAEQSKLDQLVKWKVNFKKFKSFLANQSLSLIEQQANSFLNKMKASSRIRIDGFRELASGKLKEEISIEVNRDSSLETESFGKFSGGEKAKIDLACILSMQTLINTSCINGGLDLLFCDEILESADDEAMSSIVSSLSNVDKTVFMIAHSQPNANIECEKVLVQKKNGVSELVPS